MTGVTTWVVDWGDGVGVDRSEAMVDFFKGLGSVCLGTLAGAGLGAALFFVVDASLPKQADAASAVTSDPYPQHPHCAVPDGGTGCSTTLQ